MNTESDMAASRRSPSARTVLWDVLAHMRPDNALRFQNVYDAPRIRDSLLYWKNDPFVELKDCDGEPIAVLSKADIIAIDWVRQDAAEGRAERSEATPKSLTPPLTEPDMGEAIEWKNP